jgi:hypothetical protein
MTTTNGHDDISITQPEAATRDFDLPNDFRTLAAMKEAITRKMAEMQTTGAETLRTMLLQEAEALGMSPDEILNGTAGKKLRVRKSKKRDE